MKKADRSSHIFKPNLPLPFDYSLPPFLPDVEAEPSIDQGKLDSIAYIPNNENMGEKLMNSKRTCDAEVYVGRDLTPIKVHKAILAANSKFFEKLFFPSDIIEIKDIPHAEVVPMIIDNEVENKVQENSALKEVPMEEVKKKIVSKVELLEIESVEFNQFLEYCYTGNLSLTTFEGSLQLYKLANKLSIDELKEKIVFQIEPLIDRENILKSYFDTATLLYTDINGVIKSLIGIEANKIFTKKNVLVGLNEAQVMALLEMTLNVTEDVLLQRIIEYANFTFAKDMDKKSKRKIMDPILCYIQLDKIGIGGIEDALSSGLFKKSRLIYTLINSKFVKSAFLPIKH